jgi:hypothetical protein
MVVPGAKELSAEITLLMCCHGRLCVPGFASFPEDIDT